MTFLRAISRHSLVGLENQSLLLLGGYSYKKSTCLPGIWQLKDEKWNTIGRLLQVWKNNYLKNKLLYFRPPLMDRPFTSTDQLTISDLNLLTGDNWKKKATCNSRMDVTGACTIKKKYTSTLNTISKTLSFVLKLLYLIICVKLTLKPFISIKCKISEN